MGILKIDKTHQRPGKDSFKTRNALRKINAEDKISVIGIETIFSGERKTARISNRYNIPTSKK